MKRNVTMTHLLADHINTGTLMKMEGFLVEQLVTSLLQLISTIQLRNQKYRPRISLIRAVGLQWCWWQSYIGDFTILVTESICWWFFQWLFKGSSDTSHYIFEINFGKSRIRNRTTLNLNDVVFNRFWVDPEFLDQKFIILFQTLYIDFKNKRNWV